MGSKQAPSSVTQIPKQFMPFYTNLYQDSQGAARQAAESTGGSGYVAQPFAGPFIAQPGALEQQGLQQKADLGAQLQGFAQPGLDLFGRQLAGDYLSPESNPYLRATVEAAIRPVTEAFHEQALPALQSQALQSGAFKGSSRRDLWEQGLARDLERNVGDISSQIYAGNFANERAIQQQSAQRLDEAARLAQLPPELLLQSGAGFRNIAQLGLDEALRQYEEGLNAPFRPLFPLASIIQGTNIGQSTTSYPGTGGLGGGITGALGGLGIGAGASQALGLSGGAQAGTTGLGGLLGGLAGYFA